MQWRSQRRSLDATLVIRHDDGTSYGAERSVRPDRGVSHPVRTPKPEAMPAAPFIPSTSICRNGDPASRRNLTRTSTKPA